MNRIEKNVYIGDVDDVKDYEHLEKQGIDVIINLSSWNPGREVFNDFTWITIPLRDGKGKQESFNAAVHNVIREHNSDRTVMVNCAAGVSRSAAVLSTALASNKGIKLQEALNKIREERPIVNPNQEVIQHGKNFLNQTQFTTASEEK